MPLSSRGRPRSEEVNQGILDAVLDALAEGGLAAIQIERIAARAGVSKASIYRRFDSKEDLIVAALVHMRAQNPIVSREGGARERLIHILDRLRGSMSQSRDSRIMLAVMGSQQGNGRLAELVFERIAEPGRNLVRSIIIEGMNSGDFRKDINVELALPQLLGPMFYLGMWSMIDSVAEISTEALIDSVLR
jgi:AcrR family transcriptional regulator